MPFATEKVPSLQHWQGFEPARGPRTAAEKAHPSTLLPLGTTGQDETALQDDRPAACVELIDVPEKRSYKIN